MQLWARAAGMCSHPDCKKRLLLEAKVAVSPGIGFGEHGDGHVRFSLIENEERTRQALRGMKQMFKNG